MVPSPLWERARTPWRPRAPPARPQGERVDITRDGPDPWPEAKIFRKLPESYFFKYVVPYNNRCG